MELFAIVLLLAVVAVVSYLAIRKLNVEEVTVIEDDGPVVYQECSGCGNTQQVIQYTPARVRETGRHMVPKSTTIARDVVTQTTYVDEVFIPGPALVPFLVDDYQDRIGTPYIVNDVADDFVPGGGEFGGGGASGSFDDSTSPAYEPDDSSSSSYDDSSSGGSLDD